MNEPRDQDCAEHRSAYDPLRSSIFPANATRRRRGEGGRGFSSPTTRWPASMSSGTRNEPNRGAYLAVHPAAMPAIKSAGFPSDSLELSSSRVSGVFGTRVEGDRRAWRGLVN